MMLRQSIHWVKEIRYECEILENISIMNIEIDVAVKDYGCSPPKEIMQTIEFALFGLEQKKLISMKKIKKEKKVNEKFKRKKPTKAIGIFHRD